MNTMKRYEISDTMRCTIGNMSTGYYNELLITNNTKNSIIVVDKNNNKETIAPIPFYNSEGCVEITYRKTIGPRHATGSSVDIPIPTQQISIKEGELIVSPVYIKEIDVIVCLPEYANVVNHPRFAASYEDAVTKIHKELTEKLTQPTVYLLANDPDNNIDTIYISIEGIIRTIQVTHYPSEIGCCSLMFPGKVSGNFNKIQITIAAITKGKGVVKHNGHTYYIGLNKADIRNKQIENKNSLNELYTEEEIKEQVSECKNKCAEETKHWKGKYTNLNNEFELHKEISITTEKQLNQDHRDAINQLKELKNILASREAMDKMRTAELTKQKNFISVRNEEMKLYGTIAKITLPIAISAITYLLFNRNKDT